MTQTALVWGAAGGWQVVAVSRAGDELGGLADLALASDVADPFSVQRAVLSAGQEAGEAQLFIYAAGDIAARAVIEAVDVGQQAILEP